MLSADLHVHSIFSKDGESGIREILTAAENAGLDIIAITDHDLIDGAREAVSLAERMQSNLLVIPGIEVSTAQGHLLVLGVTEPVERGLDVMDTIAKAHEMGGITILPHPFHRYRHGVAFRTKEALGMVDAVEVFNSRYIFGRANKMAERWAKRLHKPMVAGSDAHNCRYVGFGRTFIDAEKDVPSVLAAIKAGKTDLSGKRTPIRTYTKQSLRNSWRKIRTRMKR